VKTLIDHTHTVSYKLRVLSYWMQTQIPCGLTKVREPTREEIAYNFKIPAANLLRWRKEKKEGKFTAMKADERSASRGGWGRRWVDMEKELVYQFREQRAIGQPVRRSWFRKVSKESCYGVANMVGFRVN